MNNVSLDLLKNNVVLNDDDMDELFAQILHVNPPINIVEIIMKAVSVLPLPKILSKWDGFGLIVVDDDFDQLS